MGKHLNVVAATSLTATLCRYYYDKINTGFLTWTKKIKGYLPVNNGDQPLSWEAESLPCLTAIQDAVTKEGYIKTLSTLWSQESGKEGSNLEFRSDNALFFKYLGKLPHAVAFSLC